MKKNHIYKIIRFFYLAVCLLLVLHSSVLFAQVGDIPSVVPIHTEQSNDSSSVGPSDFPEIINSFRSDITVNKDGTTRVVETIRYDFHDLQKHGIFRDIPLTKVAGSDRTLRVNDILVTDEDGNIYTTSITGGSTVHIKVGDAGKTITGEHTYKIYYTTKNAIGYFDDRDEIYWNTTGNEWNIPIWESEAHIFIPGELKIEQLYIASYCGVSGSKDSCINSLPVYHKELDETEVIFNLNSDEYLDPNEGMTVAVGFPKGIVSVPIVMWWEKSETYIAAAIISITFFILLFILWLFRSYFPESNRRRQPIMVEYTPPDGISPAQAAYIYNGSSTLSKTISSEILYLASIGYISITKEDKSLKTPSGKLDSLGKIAPIVIVILIAFFVFNWILFILAPLVLILKWKDIKDYVYAIRYPANFILTIEKNVDTSKLSKHLSKLLSLVTNDNGTGKSLDDTEKDKNYDSFVGVDDDMSREIDAQYPDIKKYNEKIKFAFGVLPTFFLAVMFFVFAAFISTAAVQSSGYNLPFEAYIALVAFFISGWLYFVLRAFLSAWLFRMTDIRYKVAGLREYINIAEKERLTFQNDPALSLKIYSTLLPYATAFGLEHKWSKVFDCIVVASPSWYHSSNSWSTSKFSSSLGAFSIAVNDTSRSGMPVSSGSSGGFSGSSGGGSSGGGGGGGGGGSW